MEIDCFMKTIVNNFPSSSTINKLFKLLFFSNLEEVNASLFVCSEQFSFIWTRLSFADIYCPHWRRAAPKSVTDETDVKAKLQQVRPTNTSTCKNIADRAHESSHASRHTRNTRKKRHATRTAGASASYVDSIWYSRVPESSVQLAKRVGWSSPQIVSLSYLQHAHGSDNIVCFSTLFTRSSCFARAG